MTRQPQRSSLGLLVLWQLFQEPMHVYRMQKLFEAEGKQRIVNVRSRASLYQAIERLERLGLVEVAATERHEGYPDRIVYAITEAGREVARGWLREVVDDLDRGRLTWSEEWLREVAQAFLPNPDEHNQEEVG